MGIPTYKEEPFEWYREMRKSSPVYREGNMIHIFKYKTISRILSDQSLKISESDSGTPSISEITLIGNW